MDDRRSKSLTFFLYIISRIISILNVHAHARQFIVIMLVQFFFRFD